MTANPDEKVNEALARADSNRNHMTEEGSELDTVVIARALREARAENVALKLIAERAEQERSNADARAHHLVSENAALAARLAEAEDEANHNLANWHGAECHFQIATRALMDDMTAVANELIYREEEYQQAHDRGSDGAKKGHAYKMRAEAAESCVKSLEADLHQAKSQWSDERKRAREEEERVDLLRAEISRKDAALADIKRKSVNHIASHLADIALASPKPGVE